MARPRLALGRVFYGASLAPAAIPPYVDLVQGNLDYGDKRTRNTRLGPGGGTRRLHQTSLSFGANGVEIGSTNV